jgi:hypothetical protein
VPVPITRPLVVFGIASALATAVSAQIPAFTGAPFSAIQTIERIQILADGTNIVLGGRKVVLYRDSAGRTRNETTILNGRTDNVRTGGPLEPPITVIIFDPVSGFRYQLNSKVKVAERFAMPAHRPNSVAQGRPVSAGFLSPPVGISIGSGAPGTDPKGTSESLGSQVIEGVSAEGTRSTIIFAVGSVGNDREIVATLETWVSKQLGVSVLTKTSDPRSGDATTKLTDISLVEPNPTLFMPPADYAIKDVLQ